MREVGVLAGRSVAEWLFSGGRGTLCVAAECDSRTSGVAPATGGLGTLRDATAAPFIFGALIGNASSRGPLTVGYYLGASLMFVGGLIAWFFGVNAERQSLEDIASPLSAVVSPSLTTGTMPAQSAPRTCGRNSSGPACGRVPARRRERSGGLRHNGRIWWIALSRVSQRLFCIRDRIR